MAKLIIIDDEYIMVKMIQGQLGTINPAFAELDTNGSCKNVLCLTRNGKEYQFTNFNPNGDDPDAFTSVFQNITLKELEKLLYKTLVDYREERVLFLIDFLLRSKDINSPSVTAYIEKGEFSAELYAILARFQNNMNPGVQGTVEPNNFGFIMFSRGEVSINIITDRLFAYRDTLTEAEKETLPQDYCIGINIAWCLNRCDKTDENLHVISDQLGHEAPLVLPSSYKSYIEEL